ncbi:MAG: succinate dehydrogenase assembly factor 2 [Xanthomonadales bacterium]|nr:succinate dehydrogenase assembly factor 2 [Gammaproteobacteria bacterium]NNJ65159.1 succinate dehydrogenase assembly factor 2 [Xanthomonadales bacterium]
MPDNDRSRRLQWLCRRGMKELDVLLERFLRDEATALGQGAWPGFEEMLREEDDVLWDWLMNPALPAAERYRKLLERIRERSA